MENQSTAKNRVKTKNKKPATKNKTNKKKKCEGGTCSMFLADLTRKLQMKRMKEQEAEIPKNIIYAIIDTITNALPVVVSKKSLERAESPIKMQALRNMAPELVPNDTVQVPVPPKTEVIVIDTNENISHHETPLPSGLRIPRMPVMSNDILKMRPIAKLEAASMHDKSINTGYEHDVASEIQKHVGTLRKISLIAEEFNQKTAKNLKEIVNSVQEDLIKKLEEVQAQQKREADKLIQQMEVESVEA